ncbi:hypothetical protein BH10PSE11_BH10PSE11_12670 [soil metagenome]
MPYVMTRRKSLLIFPGMFSIQISSTSLSALYLPLLVKPPPNVAKERHVVGGI